mmetsp:Transcript_25576/g.29213  ORF Transcript_25576/g.29213 Transcript_25576/m.29213 type:complete len:353 (-) Transcript_25576:143-1201(-)
MTILKWYFTIAFFLAKGTECEAFLLKQNSLISTFKKPLISTRIIEQTNLRTDLKKALQINGGAKVLQMSFNFPVFDNSPLSLSTSIFAITNAVGFIISILTGSHKHLDLLGTGAFALASIPSLISSTSTRVVVSSGAVTIWAIKLASFLFYRALKLKTDARLDDVLSTSSGTAGFWVISLVWGIICSLPHTLGTASSSEGSPITLVLGTILYVLGLVTESKADYQKWIFKQNNPGKFCNNGLWSISQHPNFFGNLLLWSGIFVMNADSLVEPIQEGANLWTIILGYRKVFIAFLSPLFMWTLFNGQASGSFSNTADLANKKYGNDASYSDYMETVPLIIPKLGLWIRALFTN